jgi:hypothetical protein
MNAVGRFRDKYTGELLAEIPLMDPHANCFRWDTTLWVATESGEGDKIFLVDTANVDSLKDFNSLVQHIG